MHKLRIIVEDASDNLDVLILSDLSSYDPDNTIDVPLMQVKSPSCSEYVLVPFAPRTFKSAYDDEMLGLTNADILPDGLYRINYALAPHGDVNVTINHFRTESLRNSILSKMNIEFIDPTEWTESKYSKVLMSAYMYMQTTKYYAAKGKFDYAMLCYERSLSLCQYTENVRL